MIINYNFNKKIKKIDSIYYLEIIIPNIINNFYYKIYGSNGFFQNGKFTSYKNINTDNILVFSFNEIQTIFISIKINNKTEYFDFYDMLKKSFNNNFTKNIKIDIKRKIDNNANIDENISVLNDSNESSSDDSDLESEEDNDSSKNN
jgi:hypothetical protein